MAKKPLGPRRLAATAAQSRENVSHRRVGQLARTAGDDADAVCYIHADVDGTSAWGVGIAGSTTRASLEAIVSAVNRSTAAN